MAQLEAGRLARAEHATIHFLHMGPVRPGNEFQQAPSHHILIAVLAKLPVHEPHAQRLVDQEKPVRRVLCNRSQDRFGLPHSLLGELACRDVIGGTQDTGDSTRLRIAYGQRTNIQPLAFAVDGVDAGLARLRIALQDADMTRRNDRLPLFVNQRIPPALRILQRAAENRLHAIACPYRFGLVFGVVAILKHITGCHGGNSPIAELALPQGFLGVYAVGDLHEETNHARGPVAGIAFRHPPAIENPTPPAVFVTQAIFGFVELSAAGDDILEHGVDARGIFRMHPLVPESPGAIPGFGNHSQDPVVGLGMAGFAACEIPVPHSAARAFERRLQSALTANVFELGFLALFDVHAEADHAQGSAVGIPLNYTATLKQPAPTAFPIPDTIFGIVVIGFARDVFAAASGGRRDIVRVDVGIPTGHMVQTFAGMQLQPVAPVAVPTRALGAEIQLPQAHAGAPDSRFQPRLTRPELAFRALLCIDIQGDTDGGSGLAFEIPCNRAAASEHPLPLAAGRANAVLRFNGGALAAEVLADLKLHSGPVVRMDARSPRVRNTFPLLAGVAGNGEPQRAHHGDVSRNMPLPECRACAPQRRSETGLVFL